MQFSQIFHKYVGKTTRQLRCRINEHKSAIRRKDPKSAVARHFADGNHSITDLDFCGIDLITPSRRGGNTDKFLLQCECRYIYYMKTLYPNGMNEELDMSCFL